MRRRAFCASCARILGYQPHELIGRKFLDLVHPHDLQATLLHGLRACWFTPVFGARGRLIAVLAVYYSRLHEPSHRELVLVQAAVSLVALAIAHSQAQTQLKESLTRVELAQSIARLGYWERDLSSDRLIVYGETNAILGFAPERTVSLSAS